MPAAWATALACRQMAAAAATLSDSSPPGCGMRRACAARWASAASTPCPSCPSTQAQGQGRRAWCSQSPWCELVTSSGTRRAAKSFTASPSTRRRPKCAPMPARSTLGEPSAAVPVMAATCVKPKAAALRRMEPTLPASCTRSSTTVGASTASASAPGQSSTKASGAGDGRPLMWCIRASSMTIVLIAACAYSTGARGQNDAESTARAGRRPRASAARHRWSPSTQMRPCLR